MGRGALHDGVPPAGPRGIMLDGPNGLSVMARLQAIEMATEGTWERHLAIERLLTRLIGPGISVEVTGLREGPKSLETGYDVAIAGKGILEGVRRAEAEGFDAVLLCGALDPCLESAREAVRIPVVGAGQAACLTAAALGRRTGVLAVVRSHIAPLRDMVFRAGLNPDRTLFRSIDIPIPLLRLDVGQTLSRLQEEGKRLVEDGADVLVLGCTSVNEDGLARLEESLAVPVIHPNMAGALLAASLVRAHWTHGTTTYPPAEDPTGRFGDALIVH